ncbi:hypothetical protein GCM10020001_098470 [Nonomuraea salmonea]
MIDVERLNLTYGDFHAVRDLSFQVRRGEFYALLGTNGAGKTSTLETIEGHRAPTSGTVRVLGQSPRIRAAVRPKMGIMLQESGFSPDLTVRESIELIGVLSQRQDRLERVLSMVDLTRKARTKVAQLSGGEKRRLDFATAVWGGHRSWCSWTSRRPGWTSSRGMRCGTRWTSCVRTAPRSCSPRIIWRRRSSARTGSG